MSAWLYAYAFVAFWFFVAEAIGSRQIVLSAISGLMWPIAIPLGLWVAFNPKKAERIRARHGTAGHPSGGPRS